MLMGLFLALISCTKMYMYVLVICLNKNPARRDIVIQGVLAVEVRWLAASRGLSIFQIHAPIYLDWGEKLN